MIGAGSSCLSLAGRCSVLIQHPFGPPAFFRLFRKLNTMLVLAHPLLSWFSARQTDPRRNQTHRRPGAAPTMHVTEPILGDGGSLPRVRFTRPRSLGWR